MFAEGVFVSDLTIEILTDWQTRGVTESRVLDFKRDAPDLDARAEGPKRDLAADICGFANAGGGVLLLGVAEERTEDGQHLSRLGELEGIEILGGFARFQQQLESLVRDVFEPRGVVVSLKEIQLPAGRSIVAIGVERSTRAPHRLKAYSSTDFFIRTMRMVEKMDIDSVREAFRRSFTLLQDAESRLIAAEQRNDLALRGLGPILWTSLTPIAPSPLMLPPRDPRIRSLLTNMGRLRHEISSWDVGFDAHGAFLFSGSTGGRRLPLFRIMRDGTLERAEMLLVREQRSKELSEPQPKYLNAPYLAASLARSCRDIAETRVALGITGPALLTGGLHGCGGTRLSGLDSRPTVSVLLGDIPMIEEDPLFMRPRIETGDDTLQRAFKELADFFWNAGGYQDCKAFDEEGNPAAGLRL